jgi:lactate permease
LRRWRLILALSLVMGGAQYGLAAAGLAPLSAFGAGLAGVFAGVGISRLQGTRARNRALPAARPAPGERVARPAAPEGTMTFEAESDVLTEQLPATRLPAAAARPALWALGTYGALGLLMAVLTLFPPAHAWAERLAWKPRFAQVTTRGGMVTPAGPGQVFRPVSHPGTLILAVALAAVGAVHARAGGGFMAARRAASATIRSAAAPSVGIISMVGLSTLMDHCGMSWLLAQGLTSLLGAGYPLVSPCVGILGAFATGSNNNSNVLFGSLQKNVAVMLGLNPELLVASQTAGGSLGSMLAPAKIVIGCSTVGCLGDEGRVLRKTVPCGLGIGVAVGVLVLVLSRLR